MDDESPNRESPDDRVDGLPDDPADADFAASLGRLRPAAAAGLDPVEASFEAGRRAGESAGRRAAARQLFAWRAAAAALLAAGGLAVAARPASSASVAQVVVRDRLVYVESPAVPERPVPERPAPPTPTAPPAAVRAETGGGGERPIGSTPIADAGASDSLLALRQVALDRGVDRLPSGTRGWVSGIRVRGVALP